jgi:hypothetical protein
VAVILKNPVIFTGNTHLRENADAYLRSIHTYWQVQFFWLKTSPHSSKMQRPSLLTMVRLFAHSFTNKFAGNRALKTITLNHSDSNFINPILQLHL